jgi:hypothetical protein
VSGQFHVQPDLPSQKEPLLPIQYEASWAPEMVRILKRRDKYLTPTGNQTIIPQISRPYPSHDTNYAMQK